MPDTFPAEVIRGARLKAHQLDISYLKVLDNHFEQAVITTDEGANKIWR